MISAATSPTAKRHAVRILVTGAAGFVGSHLCERLDAAGWDVIGVDCFTDYYAQEQKRQNAGDLAARGIPIVNLDLAAGNLSEITRSVQVIFHLAAQPGLSSTTPFQNYVRNNILATHMLLESAVESPELTCFVNVSTSSVYGKRATESETAAPSPTSDYGVTKLAAEQLALSYFRGRQLPVCSVRLFSVYGPRERPDKLFPRLIGSILTNDDFPLFEGSEHHRRAFTYVADAVDGLVSVVCRANECAGEIFNIGSPVEMTTGSAIKMVEELLKRNARIIVRHRRTGDQVHTRADIAKARKLLGYNPTTKPEDGLRAEIDWYRRRVLGRS